MVAVEGQRCLVSSVGSNGQGLTLEDSGNGLWGGDVADGSRTDRWKPSGQMERTARIVIDLPIPPDLAAPTQTGLSGQSGRETGNSHGRRCAR